jgi:hypothetical protein
MVEVKKGLRNPLDEAQVRKAVLALQSFVDKQRAERAKQPLVEGSDSLSCILTRKVVPAKASLKPIQIDLPHSLYGGEGGAEMCLFVKDDDKQRIKEALAKDPVAGLSKVMTVKKLRKHFSRFEDKRTLAGAYDLFLADDRVLPYLKAPLGSKFFVKKKQPLPVRVSRKDVSFSIRAVAHRTALHVSTGACSNVKVARLDMTVDEVVDNIMVAMNNCAAHIPKGWGGVQSISVKTNDSVALPIYNALAPLAKLPSVTKAVALTKRKLEEIEAKKTVEEPVAEQEQEQTEPAKKKAKKADKKKPAAEPVVEQKKAKKADKKKPAAEPVVEQKKAKKADKKPAAEPVAEQKKTKKVKKTESSTEAKPSPAKKQKAKHDEPAKSPKEDKKAAKKGKKTAAPVEADAADKKKKKRKVAAKN